MKDRIKELRKSLGMTQAEFGQRLGVTTSAVSGYELGTFAPSDAVVRSICREFGVRESWLRSGEGDMRPDPPRSEELGTLLKTLLTDERASFRSALITTLLRFDPEGPEWELLEDIYRKLAAEMEKTPEP